MFSLDKSVDRYYLFFTELMDQHAVLINKLMHFTRNSVGNLNVFLLLAFAHVAFI